MVKLYVLRVSDYVDVINLFGLEATTIFEQAMNQLTQT